MEIGFTESDCTFVPPDNNAPTPTAATTTMEPTPAPTPPYLHIIQATYDNTAGGGAGGGGVGSGGGVVSVSWEVSSGSGSESSTEVEACISRGEYDVMMVRANDGSAIQGVPQTTQTNVKPVYNPDNEFLEFSFSPFNDIDPDNALTNDIEFQPPSGLQCVLVVACFPPASSSSSSSSSSALITDTSPPFAVVASPVADITATPTAQPTTTDGTSTADNDDTNNPSDDDLNIVGGSCSSLERFLNECLTTSQQQQLLEGDDAPLNEQVCIDFQASAKSEW